MAQCGQIYAEAESNANLFAIAEAQQYKIFRRKNSFKILKIKIIIVYLQPAKVYCGI